MLTRTSTIALDLSTLAASGTSDLGPIVMLENATAHALTVEATYDASAASGIEVDVVAGRASDALDTEVFATLVLPLTAGATVRKTFVVDAALPFLKVRARNLSLAVPATAVKVYSTPQRVT